MVGKRSSSSRKSGQEPKTKKAKKGENVTKKAEVLQREFKPSAARDGANVGDILVGIIRGNFGVAIQVLDEVKPISRRGHLARVIEQIFKQENIPVSDWKEEASKHMDWPLNNPNEKNITEEEFIRIVALIIEGYSAFKPISNNLLNYYDLSKITNEDKNKLVEKCEKEIDYPLEHHLLPHHACLLNIHFRILDPGTGEKSSIFREMMEESQTNENGISFDEISQFIQLETGSNDATFFLNYSNMVHPGDKIYRYEDEIAKNEREKGDHKSFLDNQIDYFKRIKNKEEFVYFLQIEDSSEKIPLLTCGFSRLKDFEMPKNIKEWNFPSLPHVRFLLIDNCEGNHDEMELEINNNNQKSNIKLSAGILKSLLQKQIRRGLAKEALHTASTLKDLKATYNPQFHTSVTGTAALLQRIIVILIEDVGFSTRLSPLCWLAFLASHDKNFKLSNNLWYYVWDTIYQITLRKKHEFFHGPSCKLPPVEISDYSTMISKYPKLSSEQLALVFGLELKCREPGMSGDKVMMRKALSVAVKGNRNGKDEEFHEKTPDDLLSTNLPWDDNLLLNLPCAVDFHAYPAVVDRIFEWDANIYSHYLQLASQKRKSSSIELLRSDMWDYSSSINCRDPLPNAKKAAYWTNTVEPIFKKVVNARLQKRI